MHEVPFQRVLHRDVDQGVFELVRPYSDGLAFAVPAKLARIFPFSHADPSGFRPRPQPRTFRTTGLPEISFLSGATGGIMVPVVASRGRSGRV